MYSRRAGLGIAAPPGPKPGTIQDPAATLGWRKMYPGDVLTAPTTATVGKPAYQAQTAVHAQPVLDGNITPVAPSPTVAPTPLPTVPAPTPAPSGGVALAPQVVAGTPYAEPTTMVTVPGYTSGSLYNAPLVSQLPFSPMAQLLLPAQAAAPLPGVATPDGSVAPSGGPAQAGFSPTTIALVVGGAVLLTMLLGKKRRV